MSTQIGSINMLETGKNKMNPFIVLILTIGIGELSGMAAATPIQIGDAEKNVIMDYLGNVDWVERFYGLNLIDANDLQDNEIKSRVITLLNEENEAFLEHLNRGMFETYQSEGYEAYYTELVEHVGRTGDEQAIPALIGVLNRAGSNLVKPYFAELGEPAALALIDTIGGPIRESSILRCLSAIVSKDNVRKGTLTNRTRQIIKDLMLNGSKSEDFYIKINAVEGLGEFSDPEVLIHLQDIVENDSTYVDRDVSGKTVRRYPIREEAQTQLNKHKRE